MPRRAPRVPRARGPLRSAPARPPAARVGASGDVVDADGHARDAYAPAGGELVAVRPDGHVGARGSETDVTAFLRGVLPAVPAEV